MDFSRVAINKINPFFPGELIAFVAKQNDGARDFY